MIANMARAQSVRHFFEYLLPEAAHSTPKTAVVALEHLAQTAPHLGGPLALVPSDLKPCSGRANGLSKHGLVLQLQQTVGRPPRSTPLCAAGPRACYGTDTTEAVGGVGLPFLASNGLSVSMWPGRLSVPANAARSSRFVRLDFGESARLPYATINRC